ncbi:MAG: DUF1116 domain-containing protein, partial [Chloroflexi bacterium]|nr:DUF1116 domain-containing protein [Chloroflexota bacterium]
MTIDTTRIQQLFSQPLKVANLGLDLFADALDAEGVEAARVEWRPPLIELEPEAAALFNDPRIEAANQEAVGQMMAAQPMLVDVRPAREVLPDMTERTFFHAGPPLDWASASGPMRGALIGAMLYEGLAQSAEQAESLAERGEIELSPCHHHEAVGPMAGVISPSMPVMVVENAAGENRAHCTLNEGLGKVLRYGANGPEVIERLRWFEHVFGPLVGAALRAIGGVDLRVMTAQAIQMGDECHNRNKAGTNLFTREIAPALVECGAPTADIAAVLRFLQGNDFFYLNLAMAMGKAAADAAHDVAGSTMVSTMARNGTEFGIRVSGLGDRWFTAPSEPVRGLYFPGYGPADANPDIGDSAITETVGIGGFALAGAPAIVQFIGGTPADALRYT